MFGPQALYRFTVKVAGVVLTVVAVALFTDRQVNVQAEGPLGRTLRSAGRSSASGTIIEAGLPPSSSSSSAPAPVADERTPFAIGDLTGLSGMLLFSASIDGRDRIFVLDLDGKRVRKVIDGPGNSSYPSWSPDGSQFVFTSDRDGKSQLYRAAWDGENQSHIPTAGFTAQDPSWSPNSDKIVYAQESSPGKDSNVYSISLNDQKPVQLTNLSGRNSTPKISPDGRSITYSTNRFWPGWDVCSFDLVERKENCLLGGATTYCRQSYSPKGDKIAYSIGVFDDIDIGILDLATSATRKVASLPGRDYDVTWSPDGKWLAFSAENGHKDLFNIYLVSSDSASLATPRELLASIYSLRYLSWSAAHTIDLEAQRMRQLQIAGQ